MGGKARSMGLEKISDASNSKAQKVEVERAVLRSHVAT